MPADVAAVRDAEDPARRRQADMKVQFQVIALEPRGRRDRRPDLRRRARARSSASRRDGESRLRRHGEKTKPIDFNSHQIVLDVDGGWQPHAAGLRRRRPPDVPAVALLMRPDGSVVVRNEADDRHDQVRKDIENNYKRELEESNKERAKFDGRRLRQDDGRDDRAAA